MKKIIIGIAATVALVSCSTDADVASKNIDKAAEQFKIHRHIALYNGITDTVFLEVFGFCSYENQGTELEFICKDEEGIGGVSNYSFGLSDNVTYMVEQSEPLEVSTSRPTVIFKPEALIPNVER